MKQEGIRPGRDVMRLSFPILAWLVLAAGPAEADPCVLPAGCRQIVAVVTPAWEATAGSLWRLESDGTNWRVVSGPVAATVGHRGLGVGLGLHPAGLAGPAKEEGDRRAPAGVFPIESAFGTKEMKRPRLPYRKTTDSDRWVDDPASSHYNQWVSLADSGVRRDWQSAEVLRRKDGLYDLALVVGHNRNPIVKGRGSAIFMHRWVAPGRSTIGCTAMDPKDLRGLFDWLDEGKKPVLVQAPRGLLPHLGLTPPLRTLLESLPNP